MDELVNQIKKILYYPKLLTINEIQLTTLSPIHLNKLIDKLLFNFQYSIYYQYKSIKHTGIGSLYPVLIDNEIINLSVDGIKQINEIIILPIYIYDNVINHIICLCINTKLNHVLYFDPFGTNKIQYNIIKPSIKKFLVDNNIFNGNKFKFITFNFPIQKYIKDDNNKWFYEMSCGILVGIFTYLYFLASNTENLINDLIKTCKMIKKKENIVKLKDLLIFVYTAIMYD
jgi:hypothetical protein